MGDNGKGAFGGHNTKSVEGKFPLAKHRFSKNGPAALPKKKLILPGAKNIVAPAPATGGVVQKDGVLYYHSFKSQKIYQISKLVEQYELFLVEREKYHEAINLLENKIAKLEKEVEDEAESGKEEQGCKETAGPQGDGQEKEKTKSDNGVLETEAK